MRAASSVPGCTHPHIHIFLRHGLKAMSACTGVGPGHPDQRQCPTFLAEATVGKVRLDGGITERDSDVAHVNLVVAHTSVFFIYVCPDVSCRFHSLDICIKKKPNF